MNPTTMLATLALLFGASASLAQNGQPMHDQQQPPHHARATHVTVQGNGEVRLAPDRAAISIGVTATAENAEEAQQQVSRAMNRVIENIRDLDLEGELLTTSGISLSPMYENSPRRVGNEFQEPRIIGYRASNSVRVRMDEVARVGEVIDTAAQSGSNTIQGVQFMLQDEHAAQLEALRDAVTKARTRAETIATAMGRTIDSVVDVTEAGAVTPIFRGGGMMAERAMMDVSTPVESGEIVVNANITMTVRLSD